MTVKNLIYAVTFLSFLSACGVQSPPISELLNKNEKIIYSSEGFSYQLTKGSMTPEKINTPDNFKNFINPQFSHDGKKIIYALQNNSPDNSYKVYIMNTDGSNKIELNGVISLQPFPAWSSDNTKIVFSAAAASEPAQNLYTVNADGTNLTRLTNDKFDYQNPSFSPDGTKIVFLSNKETKTDSLAGVYYSYLMSSDGTNIKKLFNSSGSFDWLSNDVIIYNDRFNIYTINTDGLNNAQLTKNGSNDPSIFYYERPVVSQDKNKILFTSTRDGNTEIYLLNISTGNEIRLTRNKVTDELPRWQND